MVAEPRTAPTRTLPRSLALFTSPWSWRVVSADVTPAVNTASAMIDTTIHNTASVRPGNVFGAMYPVLACVIASVDHQMLVPMPLAAGPLKSALCRRSNSQISTPTSSVSPSSAPTAWRKPNEASVLTIDVQNEGEVDGTAMPSPVT